MDHKCDLAQRTHDDCNGKPIHLRHGALLRLVWRVPSALRQGPRGAVASAWTPRHSWRLKHAGVALLLLLLQLGAAGLRLLEAHLKAGRRTAWLEAGSRRLEAWGAVHPLQLAADRAHAHRRLDLRKAAGKLLAVVVRHPRRRRHTRRHSQWRHAWELSVLRHAAWRIAGGHLLHLRAWREHAAGTAEWRLAIRYAWRWPWLLLAVLRWDEAAILTLRSVRACTNRCVICRLLMILHQIAECTVDIPAPCNMGVPAAGWVRLACGSAAQ